MNIIKLLENILTTYLYNGQDLSELPIYTAQCIELLAFIIGVLSIVWVINIFAKLFRLK